MVWIARVWSDVWTMSGATPWSAIKRPASVAWDSPSGVSGESHQPVKRFSLFHSLSPWRSSTSRCTIGGHPTRVTQRPCRFRQDVPMSDGPALRVVVVDNDDAALELVVTDLSLEGHDVVGTCLDGTTALDLCTHLQPDVAVVDHRMPPGPHGLEVAQRLAHDAPDVRVIVFTNYQDPELVEQIRAERGHLPAEGEPPRPATGGGGRCQAAVSSWITVGRLSRSSFDTHAAIPTSSASARTSSSRNAL